MLAAASLFSALCLCLLAIVEAEPPSSVELPSGRCPLVPRAPVLDEELWDREFHSGGGDGARKGRSGPRAFRRGALAAASSARERARAALARRRHALS